MIFRTLERLHVHQEFPESLNRLENNWQELNQNFQAQSVFTSEFIINRFEHHSYCGERHEKLGNRLRHNKKVGINLISPLDRDKHGLKILTNIIKAINVAGIPLALWRVNKNNHPEKLKQEFIELLTSKDINNFKNLLSKIERLRGEAYDSDSDNPEENLGYGLGFLCDNPYRVPSRFQEEGDDAFTFG